MAVLVVEVSCSSSKRQASLSCDTGAGDLVHSNASQAVCLISNRDILPCHAYKHVKRDELLPSVLQRETTALLTARLEARVQNTFE